MDLSLTEEQEMLKTAVRRFVDTEYPKETLLELAATGQNAPSEPWSKLAATGWLGIIIPTEYGGEGGSFTDAGVLFEELGRGPVPGPHLSSAALGALAILEAGTEEQKRSLLPDVAGPEVIHSALGRSIDRRVDRRGVPPAGEERRLVEACDERLQRRPGIIQRVQ